MTNASVLVSEQLSSMTSSLLESVKQGNDSSWRRLVDSYLPLIYWWCKREGLQDADVRDIGQTVLVKLWEYLPSFDRHRDNATFRGWLRTIVRHAIADHFRKEQKRPKLADSDVIRKHGEFFTEGESKAESDTEEAEAGIVCARVIQRIKAQFPERQWQAFVHVVMYGRSPADVAEELEMTRNQVYLARSRIAKCVREHFGEILETGESRE